MVEYTIKPHQTKPHHIFKSYTGDEFSVLETRKYHIEQVVHLYGGFLHLHSSVFYEKTFF